MAKTPKAPKFQNLPTLEGLAARRRQTIASILDEWGVKDAPSLVERLKREGLAPVENAEALFIKPWKEPVVLLKNTKGLNTEMMTDAVERAKKVLKDTEEAEQKAESKKPVKAKLTSDAPAPTDVDRAPAKPAVVVPEEAGKPPSKA